MNITNNEQQEVSYCSKHKIILSDDLMIRRECLKVPCHRLMRGDLVSGNLVLENMEYVFPIKHGNIDPKVKMRCWVNIINRHPEIKPDHWNEILI